MACQAAIRGLLHTLAWSGVPGVPDCGLTLNKVEVTWFENFMQTRIHPNCWWWRKQAKLQTLWDGNVLRCTHGHFVLQLLQMWRVQFLCVPQHAKSPRHDSFTWTRCKHWENSECRHGRLAKRGGGLWGRWMSLDQGAAAPLRARQVSGRAPRRIVLRRKSGSSAPRPTLTPRAVLT